MIVAEKNARTHYCPLSRYPDAHDNCVGLSCMMWRWASVPRETASGHTYTTESDEHGFCGLAGLPFAERNL